MGDPNVSSYHQVFVNPNVPGLTGPGLPAAVILNNCPPRRDLHHLHDDLPAAPELLDQRGQLAGAGPAAGHFALRDRAVRRAGRRNGDGLLDLVGVASGSVSFPNNILTTHVVWTLGAAAAPYFTIPAAVSSGLATLVNNLPVRVAT